MNSLSSLKIVGSAESASKDPTRALPASWYTSEDMYEFERRAIFSTRWLLITHKNRITQTGDWLKFSVAGFEFVIVRDRQGNITAFHNVCRHRAYPVVQGADKGNSKIFNCKYHGWSYALNGNLAKAPRYDEFETFDKTENGLFQVHTKVDAVGFIWVNMNSSDNPEPWEQQFDGIDKQLRLRNFNLNDYILDHDYQMDGEYNWKILADNFNECYHCPSSHPDLGTLADLRTLRIDTAFSYIMHSSTLSEGQQKEGLGICSTYFYPNSSVVILRDFMMIQRFSPLGAKRSSMQYQIFRNKHASDSDFKETADMYHRIMVEDKALCEGSQKNLNVGVFVNGEMHSRLEYGPLFFQKVHRDFIRAHFDLEQDAKRQIWPARSTVRSNKTVSDEDELLCVNLACTPGQETLVW